MKQTAQQREVIVEKKIDTVSLEEWSFPCTEYRYEALSELYRSLERDFLLLERRFGELRRKLRDANIA